MDDKKNTQTTSKDTKAQKDLQALEAKLRKEFDQKQKDIAKQQQIKETKLGEAHENERLLLIKELADTKAKAEVNKAGEILDLDKKVKVSSIATITVSFPQQLTPGDVVIKPGSFTRLTRAEIEKQVRDGETLLGGIDGTGNHAALFIDDDATREYLGFDTKEGERTVTPFLLTDAICERILKYKGGAFREQLESSVKTAVERKKILDYARKHKLNDYNKLEVMAKVLETTSANLKEYVMEQ